MHCNGLTIPRSDFRFFDLTTPISSSSNRPIKFPIRTPIRFAPLKAVSIDDGLVVAEASSVLSFYDLLGIPESGSLPEIKHAYKQLARKYHPDVSPPGRVEEYTKRFIQVQEAYETLSDPGRRAMYDRDMVMGLHLAFSSRRRYHDDEIEQKSEWKARWHTQLSNLKKRSDYEEADTSMSWAARMRHKREESLNEL